jgi:catechol 2,3-dioxygenase
MNTDLLAPDTRMGAVTLRVANLDAMTAYYRDAVTLSVLAASGDEVVLGRGPERVLILVRSAELQHAPSRSAGLFHTAILFDSDADLATAVASVATTHPGTFTGSADHLVSKAFYFTDPEGNGVELYTDRDRSRWSWTHGRVEMDTLLLDPRQFLRDHLNPTAVTAAPSRPATVGHVHLCVGDVDSARRFYVDQLGFETTAELGNTALFVSAGGYHHHMAMNTWKSRGAGRRRLTLGLGLVRIDVPSNDDIASLTDRLNFHGVQTRDDGHTVEFDDPWTNRILVRSATAA